MKNWDNVLSSIKKLAWVLLGQSLVINLALLAVPVYTLQVFDRVLVSGRIESLMLLLAGVLIFALSGLFFEHLKREVMCQLSAFISRAIKPALQEKLDSQLAGEKLLLRLETLRYQLTSGAFTVLLDVMWIPLALLVCFLIHPAIGLFVLAVNAVMALLVVVKFRDQSQSEKAVFERNVSQINEAEPHVTMKRYLKGNNLLGQFRESQAGQAENVGLLAALIHVAQQAMKWTFQLGLPTIGALLLLSGSLSIGGFLAALIVASRTFPPFDALVHGAANLIRDLDTWRDVSRLLSGKDEHAGRAGIEPALEGVLHLRNVTTSNSSKLAGVKEVNLMARPGDMVAMIGEQQATGEMISLLSGHGEIEEGQVTLDEFDLADISTGHIAEHVATLRSDILLPAVPIKQLITGFGAVKLEEATACAKALGLNALIQQLELSYDDTFKAQWHETAVGRRLAQLVLLTATLSRKAKVYLVEAPEQHLDPAQVEKVTNVLRQKADEGATIIISTSSKHVLQSANSFYCFEGSEVVKSGAPAFLRTELASSEPNETKEMTHVRLRTV